MALKTDIKRVIQNNTKLTVNKVRFIERPQITPNGKYEVYTVEIYVKTK